MKARIGVVESSKVVEVEVDDLEEFKKGVAEAIGNGAIVWFTDTRGREIGLPADKVAYVEVEGDNDSRSVGFAPAV